MIVLDLELKEIYGFNDFHINFSYPKKIVNSIIDQEYLKGRERFYDILKAVAKKYSE